MGDYDDLFCLLVILCFCLFRLVVIYVVLKFCCRIFSLLYGSG